MENIHAMGGSNVKKSINTVFAQHIAKRITNALVTSSNWRKFANAEGEFDSLESPPNTLLTN